MNKIDNNIKYDTKQTSKQKTQSNNNTVSQQIEDQIKNKAAKYAVGATAFAAIVIGVIATKGKLWGKDTNTIKKPISISTSINQALKKYSKTEDSIYDFITKANLHLPNSLQEEFRNTRNIEKIIATTDKTNGICVLKYKNPRSNQIEILSFNNEGHFLKRITENNNGYTTYDSKGQIAKTVEKSNIRKPKELFSKELVDVGTSLRKCIYDEGKVIKKEIFNKIKLKNGVQGYETTYRIYGQDGITKDIERTYMHESNKTIIFEKNVLENKRRIKIDNNDWIEIKDSQLADLIPKEYVELFKKGKGWK